MASTTHKIYHVHGCDSRQALEDYFSDKPEMVFEEDSLIFPIENLAKTFTIGHIKGDVLIDLSFGSFVHQLYAACECFKHIIVLKVSDRCIMELKRWLDTRTGAFNWGHAAKLHGEIQGNSKQSQDHESKVRFGVQHVMKFDLEKENMTDPIVLPPADCIISAWLLNAICKDQDDFMRFIRKFSKLLKTGGHLIFIGCLDMTYYMVGNNKLHSFKYDEDFARKALVREGFVIDSCVTKKASRVSDHIDYKGVIFIVAHKEK
ncbi:indolethylamine N-methyltransferase-like [Hyla sarda]|uniref:indolethylamine N-methyltransferase-like n=1 Tax=Hyla sarda TaxID=327740 RepID=UPI0024C23461|nr:indolethylamine N-methyltransferase-like [Hyla sarda]